MTYSRHLFSRTIKLWEATRPSSYKELTQFTRQLRAFEPSFNLTIVDMRSEYPDKCAISVVQQVSKARKLLRYTSAASKTVGEYHDLEFKENVVLLRSQLAKQTNEIQIDSVCTTAFGRLTAYDRLILPIGQSVGMSDYALTVVNMRYSIPVENAAVHSLEAGDWAVLHLLYAGMSAEEVAGYLSISNLEVEGAINRIITRLKARNVAHAVVLAMASDVVLSTGLMTSGSGAMPSLTADLHGVPEEYQRQGVFLVDASARVLSMNAVAMDTVAHKGLRIDNGYLRTNNVTETAALHGLIASCLRDNACDGSSYAIASREHRPALSLLIKRHTGCVPAWGQKGPAVRVIIADPELLPLPTAVQLRQQFGLTATEALVALELLSTDGVPGVANRLGIGAGTVKTHLIRIFQKTGTSRQSELVRFLLAIGHSAMTFTG